MITTVLLKTPTKKMLLQLGKVFFYLIIFSSIVIYVFPFVTKVISYHQNRRDQQLIEKVTQKQDSLQMLLLKNVNSKFESFENQLKITNSVLSSHIVRTEKDNKEIQQSIEKLFYNKTFYSRKDTGASLGCIN